MLNELTRVGGDESQSTTAPKTLLNFLVARIKENVDTVLDNLALNNLKVGYMLATSEIQEEDNTLLATHIARCSRGSTQNIK